jgi:uncharacterized phiE125 gp8 family phage protein
MIAAYAAAAETHLDGWSGVLGRALVTQVWRWSFSDWQDGMIRIGLPPIQSVVVQYTDAAGATQTLAADQYHLVTDDLGPAIVAADGVSWPELAARPDAVRISATCGYGDPASVPWGIRAAALLIMAGLYENREAQVLGVSVAENPATAMLIAPYRLVAV